MASHHLMLGHGLAVPAIRSAVPDARLGITLNLYPVHPLADAAGMHDPAGYDDAVRRIDGLANRWFLDPVLRGRYPEDVLADLADVAPGDFIEPGDEAVIAAPLDFLGVNYYTRHMVAPSAFPGSNRVDFGTRGAPRTAMGWEVYPGGLVELLDRLHREYPPIPIVVTENGAAFADDPDPDGRIRDHDRVSYLAHHVGAAATARQRGIPLDGYFAWSLMDNFEWGEGNDKRFGLVYIDYTTQERTIKDSGHWYASWIRRHREETESTVD
jgi:beta-glucosidase